MIITDEKFLRSPCTDVTESEAGELINKLERELKRSEELGRPGIGLAAIQIGITKKVAIIRVPGQQGQLFSANLVNAEIVNGYDKSIFENEGCLSFPNRTERTMRYGEIHVKNGPGGTPQNFIATGLFAVCIQHELDHTKGIVLPDIALPKAIAYNKPDPLKKIQTANANLANYLKNSQ